MLQTIVLFAHLVVASLIIVFVLLQRGKGADAGTGFGAGASGTVFGARGTSNFFSRTTATLAVLFFATSLTLAYFASQRTAPASLLEGSVIGDPGQETPSAVPPLNEPGGLELPQLEIEPADSSGEAED
jgi:preprotein translocase subunit SecG